MLKDLIKIANELDKYGFRWAADAMDDIILSFGSDKPAWVVNPMSGLNSKESLGAAIGYAEIENGDAERGCKMALEQAKSKLRANLKPGESTEFVADEEYYEPDMIDPDKVWVRVVLKKAD